jgi:cytochrome b561
VLAWISQLTHAATAYALVGALALHLALVLKHQWVDRDGLLDRMLPFSRR